MSKKPVPKKKQAVSSTRSRHSKFVYGERTRLQEGIQLTTCSHCGAKRRVHYACGECGYYRGRKVLNVSTAGKNAVKTTEIEA